MNKISRSALIRLASSLPAGDENRRTILAMFSENGVPTPHLSQKDPNWVGSDGRSRDWSKDPRDEDKLLTNAQGHKLRVGDILRQTQPTKIYKILGERGRGNSTYVTKPGALYKVKTIDLQKPPIGFLIDVVYIESLSGKVGRTNWKGGWIALGDAHEDFVVV